jgi:hypothetical protein
MRTKDFVAAIEAAFVRAYSSETNFVTVPYTDDRGEISECLGVLLHKKEHFAVVIAHAAHWIAEDPDALFGHNEIDGNDVDTLEDFANLVGGMKVAPYMQWSCVYFPGLTEEQVLGSDEAGYDAAEERLAHAHIELAPPAETKPEGEQP